MNYPDGKLTEQIIGAAIEVHKYWGPGLSECLYENSLCCELGIRGIRHERQLRLPLCYKGHQVGEELRLDVYVESRVVVELKSVTQLISIHESQLMTYMRLTNSRAGLLINFNVAILKDGIKRMVL
jgi:GxxExxY protein